MIELVYEIKFENGTEINRYLACAYAEGFCEGENATPEDQMRAWSYLCGSNAANSLQGWYGRTINNLINEGFMNKLGKVNWDKFNNS